jgi:hypothetical protein
VDKEEDGEREEEVDR